MSRIYRETGDAADKPTVTVRYYQTLVHMDGGCPIIEISTQVNGKRDNFFLEPEHGKSLTVVLGDD